MRFSVGLFLYFFPLVRTCLALFRNERTLAFLKIMPFTEPSQIGDLYFAFLGILFEGAPYILLGTIISGFIDAYLPSNMIDRFLPKNRYAAIALAGLLGTIFPVCECAIVPVIRRLVQKGLPVSCAITYMLSAPIVNPIVALSTYSAFAGNDPLFMTLSRIGVAYLITVLVGIVVHQFSIKSILRNNLLKKIQTDSQNIQSATVLLNKEKETPDRLLIALRSAARDFLDVGMYFVIGVMITALYRTQINQGLVDQFGSSDLIGIPAMMFLSFVLSLCSTSDAFIAAQMLSFSSAAKLAFLTYGPMMDVKLVFMYSSVFKPRFVLSLAVGLFIVIGILFYQWSNIPVPGT